MSFLKKIWIGVCGKVYEIGEVIVDVNVFVIFD